MAEINQLEADSVGFTEPAKRAGLRKKILFDVAARLGTVIDASPKGGDSANPATRSMDTAPRDGTMVRLLVQFTDNATEDATGPAWTIGANNDDNVGEDERIGWQFAGWCWDHDHFTEGKGTPVGWLPMLDSPKGGSDTARLDALETLVDDSGALLLHHGCDSGRCFNGLGLRNTGRSLGMRFPITDVELADMCGTTVYEIERGRERDAAAVARRQRRNEKRASDAKRTKEGKSNG